MAAKTGRPTAHTDKIAEEICERIANGQSLREIERDEAMPSARSVYRWLAHKDHDAFRQQYAHARERQADYFAEEILEIADDGSNDWMQRRNGDGEAVEVVDHEHISRSKLRVDARKWLMSKLAPKKYGDRITTELTGPGGGPVQTVNTNMSAKEAAEAYASTLSVNG